MNTFKNSISNEVDISVRRRRGLPYSVSGTSSGSLVTSAFYNALGSMTDLNLNNSTKTTFGYYGTGGGYDTAGGYFGRLCEIKTTRQPGSTSVLQDVQHTWDAAGNLTQRDDVVGLATEYLEYDPLDRLTSPASAAVVYSPGEHCAKFLYWK